MKKIILILCAISVPPLLFVFAMLLYAISFEYAPPCLAPTGVHIARMEWLIYRGRMGWDGKIEEAFEKLRTCKKDKQSLARTLLLNEDETIVSLGMDLVVQESFEDGESILSRYDNDKRVNFNLAYNSDYARLLTAIWRMKKGIPLSMQDKKILDGWSGEFLKKFNVVRSAPVHPLQSPTYNS